MSQKHINVIRQASDIKLSDLDLTQGQVNLAVTPLPWGLKDAWFEGATETYAPLKAPGETCWLVPDVDIGQEQKGFLLVSALRPSDEKKLLEESLTFFQSMAKKIRKCLGKPEAKDQE